MTRHKVTAARFLEMRRNGCFEQPEPMPPRKKKPKGPRKPRQPSEETQARWNAMNAAAFETLLTECPHLAALRDGAVSAGLDVAGVRSPGSRLIRSLLLIDGAEHAIHHVSHVSKRSNPFTGGKSESVRAHFSEKTFWKHPWHIVFIDVPERGVRKVYRFSKEDIERLLFRRKRKARHAEIIVPLHGNGKFGHYKLDWSFD